VANKINRKKFDKWLALFVESYVAPHKIGVQNG